ncbi:head-tail connector protein [Bacillus badius]|uniref:head-tail connector protein n=1 Tax=Bacillus badius TaxID=1455 RepID=UPI002E20CD5B|nr:head-tail connector protein [Bacillus badius]MED0665671.1 head-tail connector protein [Bacillus badius]
MLIDIQEARDTLRLDGADNDIIIVPLLEAIPSYLETTTGRSWEDTPVHPLAQTVTKFILQLWYAPESQDAERIKRTIDNLLTALTALGRGMKNNGS